MINRMGFLGLTASEMTVVAVKKVHRRSYSPLVITIFSPTPSFSLAPAGTSPTEPSLVLESDGFPSRARLKRTWHGLRHASDCLRCKNKIKLSYRKVR